MIDLKCFEGKSPFEVLFSADYSTESLNLSYKIKGNIGQVMLDNIFDSPQRIIGLWEKTCFEFFIKNKNSNEYIEFNFGSGNEWNMFIFEKIRGELKEYPTSYTPKISISNTNKEINILIKLPTKIFPIHFFIKEEMNYSPTTIIKTSETDILHFASIHPQNKLDFHRYESFDQSL
jgi:hypothetical protein